MDSSKTNQFFSCLFLDHLTGNKLCSSFHLQPHRLCCLVLRGRAWSTQVYNVLHINLIYIYIMISKPNKTLRNTRNITLLVPQLAALHLQSLHSEAAKLRHIRRDDRNLRCHQGYFNKRANTEQVSNWRLSKSQKFDESS